MQIIWQIGVFQVNLQLPKLLMGFLTTLGKGTQLILQKTQEKRHEQVPLSTVKNASQFWGIQAFLGAYRPKRCAAAAAADRVQGEVEGGESKGEGRKHGLEDADLGLFYAGVRHLYAPAKNLFGGVKTGKGRRKFVYFFSAKNPRFRGSFLNILKLDRFSCATR